MRTYADCTVCGGEVEERHINYDYRRRDHMLVLRNVRLGYAFSVERNTSLLMCLRGWISAFTTSLNEIQQPDQVLDVPAVNF